ncbi:MAG TPA: hypothetical protein VGO11_25545 [Chthoniobacteraceae bacterium]|nr:hypothetical protein [Chthoniobacteraceae bacterium]
MALSCRLMAQDPEAFLLAQEPGDRTLAPPAETPRLAPARPAEAEPVVVVAPMKREEVEVKGLKSVAGFTNQRFGYVLHGRVQAQYDSNIFIQSTGEQSDFIFTITPGVAIGLGDFKDQLASADSFRYRFERYADKNFLYLDYAPSFVAFADHSGQDSFDQDLRLHGEYTFQKLTVGLRAGWQRVNAPSADIGSRVENSHVSAALTNRYEVSGKTGVEANFYYDNQQYDSNGGGAPKTANFVDSQEFRTEEWLNFRALPKTTASVGVAAGQVERSEGPSETYEQVQFRLLWEASSKLTLSAVAGPELRQIHGHGNEVNGVFALHATWAPTERAYYHVQTYRDVQPSGAVGEDFTATGVKLQYHQRLLERYFFDLSGGYERADYSGSAGDGTRHDDFWSARTAVGLGLTRWLTAEVAGEYRNNSSSDADRSFEETRATLVFDVLF